MHRHRQGAAANRFRVKWPIAVVLIATALGMAGCGGGGSSGPGSTASAPANPRSSDVGDVTVTVTDVFGQPAAGALVYASSNANGAYWSSNGGLATDAQGKVLFNRVPTGRVFASASTESPMYAGGRSSEIELSANGRVDLAITLTPQSDYDGGPGGFAASSVAPDGVSVDGRTLEFTLQMFPFHDGEAYMQVNPCGPDWIGSGVDCVVGPTGSVAEYSVESGVSSNPRAGGAAAPVAVSLLVDQSRSMVAIDPWDARLFGMKYFLVRKPSADAVQLAAFAADDAASGERSQLPQQPVTLFPLANPRFVAAPDELLPTIETLPSLEGGAAPLYASIDALLDHTAAHAPNTVRRAVVVLTDGTDDTCGPAAACAQLRARVSEKSRALGISLVIIAIGFDWMTWKDGGWPLAELAERSGGIVLWAGNTSDIGPIVERLPAILNGSESSTTARFRIRASTDGAFHSGAIVKGTLGWGWGWLPFAVRVP